MRSEGSRARVPTAKKAMLKTAHTAGGKDFLRPQMPRAAGRGAIWRVMAATQGQNPMPEIREPQGERQQRRGRVGRQSQRAQSQRGRWKSEKRKRPFGGGGGYPRAAIREPQGEPREQRKGRLGAWSRGQMQGERAWSNKK